MSAEKQQVTWQGRTLLSSQDLQQWERDGYVIVRGLWTCGEIAACKGRFDALAESGKPVEGFERNWEPDPNSEAPLKRYPRVMQPHLFDDVSKQMLLDARIERIMAALMGEEPIAAQSMFYFKPPGGKGQALHQDNYYLEVRPKTCVAAWTAVDRSHPENGGLYICPGTHTMKVVCPELANPEESFTTHFVRPPAGVEPIPAVLDPGDVLLFGGSIVHGSKPNTTADEWRRSFICHYAPASLAEMSGAYPAMRFDGSNFDFQASGGGGPCGVEFPDGWMPSDWDEAKQLGMKPVTHGSIPG